MLPAYIECVSRLHYFPIFPSTFLRKSFPELTFTPTVSTSRWETAGSSPSILVLLRTCPALRFFVPTFSHPVAHVGLTPPPPSVPSYPLFPLHSPPPFPPPHHFLGAFSLPPLPSSYLNVACFFSSPSSHIQNTYLIVYSFSYFVFSDSLILFSLPIFYLVPQSPIG